MPSSVMGDDPPNVVYQRLEALSNRLDYMDVVVVELRHDKEEAEKRIGELHAAGRILEAALENQNNRIKTLELALSSATPAASTTRTQEPKMAEPPMFNGNREDIIPFLSKCRLKFEGQPSTFPNDRIKIMYAASRLEGPAFAWFTPLNERLNDPAQLGPPELESFDSFADTLKLLYGDPNLHENAERHIRRLRQYTSVSAYIQEFERNRQYVTWNDAALRHAFYEGLGDQVKDAMVPMGVPDELTALQKMALRIDARLESRKQQAKSTPNRQAPAGNNKNSSQRPLPSWYVPTSSNQSTGKATPANTPTAQSNPAPRANFPSHTPDGTVPMELGSRGPRPSLTDQEKQYRRNNGFCLYCGKPGHNSYNCPVAPPLRPRPQAAFNIDVTGPMENTETIRPTEGTQSENDNPRG